MGLRRVDSFLILPASAHSLTPTLKLNLSKVIWAPGCTSLNHLTSKKSVEEVVTTLTSPHTQAHYEKATV